MIEEDEQVILAGSGREYYVKAGPGQISTDKGMIQLGTLVGKEAGETVHTHSGTAFVIRRPRPPTFSPTENVRGHRCSRRILASLLPAPE